MKVFFKNILLIILIVYIAPLTAKDSLNIYFNQIYNSVLAIKELKQQVKEQEAKIIKLNQKIDAIHQEENINWFKKWQLSRLVNEKADISDNKINFYQHIKTQKEQAYNHFNRLFPIIENNIDSLINNFQHSRDSTERKVALEKLVFLKSKRDWLIDTQQYFLPASEQVVENRKSANLIVQTLDKNPDQKDEIIEFLQNRIRQLEMMSQAGKQEKLLRDKLDQFDEEMSALSNESFAITSDNLGNEKELPQQERFNEEYSNWEKNTSGINNNVPVEKRILNRADYLYLFQDISEDELSTSIKELDSLRTLYESLLQSLEPELE